MDASAWFAARTTHASRHDVATLAALKREQGTTVSVVLPALDEGPTVAAVVAAALALRDTLVDEVVVVDGGSTDDTVARAAAAGARVCAGADVRPDLGPILGKGDALWRSLDATAGDLLVFLDSDIRNPHPRFVSGLLGPLLEQPDVGYVKAFYERPVPEPGDEPELGGGRVTELCARPLLNLFWPELAAFVQPLSGEYAGRRSLLESVPFFSGYGVELGLLIDILRVAGLGALAQVDVEERIHRNQSLHALSRMAYAVTQVAARRLRDEGRLEPVDAAPYLQFFRVDGEVEPRATAVELVERPAIR